MGNGEVKPIRKLDKSVVVNIGTAVVVCAFLVTHAFLIGSWKTEMEARLEPLPKLVATVHAVELDVTQIKSNRYTSMDAQKDQVQVFTDLKELWLEIGAIKAEIAQIPREIPPAWLLERIDRIEGALEKINEKLNTG